MTGYASIIGVVLACLAALALGCENAEEPDPLAQNYDDFWDRCDDPNMPELPAEDQPHEYMIISLIPEAVRLDQLQPVRVGLGVLNHPETDQDINLAYRVHAPEGLEIASSRPGAEPWTPSGGSGVQAPFLRGRQGGCRTVDFGVDVTGGAEGVFDLYIEVVDLDARGGADPVVTSYVYPLEVIAP